MVYDPTFNDTNPGGGKPPFPTLEAATDERFL
jgi:hypothetical protein